MQNDSHSHIELLDAGDDEYKKQLNLLLEKRRLLREHSPHHPADDPAAPVQKALSSQRRTAPKEAARDGQHESKVGETLGKDPAAVEESINAAVVSADTTDARQPLTMENQGGNPIDAPSFPSPAVRSTPASNQNATSSTRSKRIPKYSHGLIVVSCAFRHLPSLSEKTKEVATSLFNALVDAQFNRFSHRGSRLLLNPSVIEFQDTMKELQDVCEPDSSFFLCISVSSFYLSYNSKGYLGGSDNFPSLCHSLMAPE